MDSERIPSAFEWRLQCVPARHVERSPQPLIIGPGPGINGRPSKVATPMSLRKKHSRNGVFQSSCRIETV